MPPPGPLTPPTRSDRKKTLVLLIIPAYLLVFAILYRLEDAGTYPQPFLLLLLNVVFLGLIPLQIAYVSFLSFRRGGSVSTLLLGAGMLFIGLGAIAAGLVGLLPNAANLVVTVHNTSTCIGASLQLLGALTAYVGWRAEGAERRTAVASAAYAATVAATAALVLAALSGLTPVFFEPGAGPTVLRTIVLIGAIEFLLMASGLFFVLYRRRAEDFFFWYAVGLVLIGLGLIGVSFYSVFDDPLNWAARIGQYVGACFLFVAFVVLQRRATSGRLSVQEMLSAFFAEAEAGYRQLVETAGDAIVVLGPDSRILLWNAAAEGMFGYARDEAVGRSFQDLVLRDAESPFPGDGTADPLHHELEARRRDGGAVPIDLTASRRTIDGQTITTCIIRDLSERKRTEQELREREQRFRLALRNAPVSVAVMDRDLRYVWAYNQRTAPPEGVVGLTDAEIFTADEAARLTAIKRRVLDEAVEVREQLWLDRPGGPIYLDCYFEPVRDDNGRVAGVGIATVDLTQRKRAEDALRESERRFRMLHESLRDAFVEVSMDGRISAFNDIYCEMLGYSQDEMRALTYQELTPERWHVMEDRIVREQIIARGYSDVYEKEYRRKDGTVIPVELRTILSSDDAGRPIAMWGIVRDITGRKRDERRLAEYAERLRTSNEELQRFAYVASHDLQEPLRSIVSFSQLLERRYRGKLDQDADDYIGFIVEGGVRMQALIHDLLQLSRVETQARPLAPTEAKSVVTATLRTLEAPLREACATVTVGDLPVVMADAAQLAQVFTNLVGNALKYRREGVPPEIRISAERHNGMVEFAVADNGIGIEAEYFDRIFEMFRRLHTHDRYEGTGIGLAVVKKIVERHGGTIRVESTPGEGSTFFFTLPTRVS